ncbi:induced myeloid leukemia cell differentiation protein Mcl-1b [Cottoperca gobio]|uniref:Induced myeloid leukemia cell differentiation protein Mcl-1b n=1 Tax=Cottoperca gobio TaxID=56716 RepID=A0A6J2R8N7_COTGO|nr:induced myeloid leukemia cell differentiation protein Mcl-1-like [Cottoperca gobio]
MTTMSHYNLPQNGVAEGAMHYGLGNSSPKDSHSGNVGLNDAPKRPKSLGVKTTKASNDMDDESLPCSPELLSDSEDSGCGAVDEVLENDTRQLISCVLRDLTEPSKSSWMESPELTTMKRVVEDLLLKHRYAYNGMLKKLPLDDCTDDASFVSAVAKSLFADGTTNWGRIASLVAFGAVVSRYLKERGRDNDVELVGQQIATYLLSDQRDWLVKNNAWDGFVKFFQVADPESTVRNTLMAFAGFAGIGATLALLIRSSDVM